MYTHFFFQLSKSGPNTVYLRNLTLKSEGRYTCQVSADEPYFGCVQVHRNVVVYSTYFFFRAKYHSHSFMLSTYKYLSCKSYGNFCARIIEPLSRSKSGVFKAMSRGSARKASLQLSKKRHSTIVAKK